MTTKNATIEIASADDRAAAIANELQAAGVESIEDLRAQALAREFTSERARRAWFNIAPLGQEFGAC